MPMTVIVESKPAFVGAIVQRRRALQKLFGAHRVVLDFCSGKFCLYEPMGQWQRVPTLEPAGVA
ncbi:MAG: hypothetical protein E6K61_06160 [Nitrospirae bacterium]|nr:MAG: hypothetical protein E6K61_06160 [Nitrospirota bacterium]